MVKVVEMTQEEKLKMYMETDKEKLALMLINCNDIIDVLLKEKSGNLPKANRNAVLADVTAAEVEIIVDALYSYQLQIMGCKELEVTNFAVKILLDKLTKDLPEID